MKFHLVEDKVYTFKREASAYALLLAEERQEPIHVHSFDIDAKAFREWLKANEDKWDYPSDAGFTVEPPKKKRKTI